MVVKRRKYANGGQITDHSTETNYRYPKPTYAEAVKDRVKGLFTSGAAAKAAKQVDGGDRSRRKKQIDDAVDKMSG